MGFLLGHTKARAWAQSGVNLSGDSTRIMSGLSWILMMMMMIRLILIVMTLHTIVAMEHRASYYYPHIAAFKGELSNN